MGKAVLAAPSGLRNKKGSKNILKVYVKLVEIARFYENIAIFIKFAQIRFQ
jgi:hypothetical protein